MKWEEFYDYFLDCEDGDQSFVKLLPKLTTYPCSKEVVDLAYIIEDENEAANFLLRAFAAGVDFEAEDYPTLHYTINVKLIDRFLLASKRKFTRADLEEIEGCVSDEVFRKVCAKNGVYFDEPSYDYSDNYDSYDIPEPKQKKTGFFGMLGAALLGTALGVTDASEKNSKHWPKCNGDCANCPPHYGYRYGRWYYGHDHTGGCEFGGNRGSGRMD